MRIHRFFIDKQIQSKQFDIGDRDLIHQWKSVFRYNVGSQVIVFNGENIDYRCIIVSLRNLGATLEVIEKIEKPIIKKDIWLCMALIKKDNFELVAQKATEIGVKHIIPILCENSEKTKINIKRIKKIILESVEQSGRGDIPEIYEPILLKDLFLKGILPQEKVILDPKGDNLDKYKSSLKDVYQTAIFIGPEGGFSQKELDLFKNYNIRNISLGPQILRAETAAIVSSSLFIF